LAKNFFGCFSVKLYLPSSWKSLVTRVSIQPSLVGVLCAVVKGAIYNHYLHFSCNDQYRVLLFFPTVRAEEAEAISKLPNPNSAKDQ